MGIFGRPTAWRATSAWSTLIRLPQIGPYLNDTDRPEPLKFFRTMRSSWSRAICYDLLPEKHGPVAQRLEQGTHNLAFCSRRRFRHWTVSEQTRRLATE